MNYYIKTIKYNFDNRKKHDKSYFKKLLKII